MGCAACISWSIIQSDLGWRFEIERSDITVFAGEWMDTEDEAERELTDLLECAHVIADRIGLFTPHVAMGGRVAA